MIDRPYVKGRARQIIQTARPNIFYASIIMTALSVLLGYLSGRLVGITNSEALRYMQYIESGNMDAALNYLAARSPSSGERLMDLLLQSVNIIISLGFLIYLLNTVRGTGAVLGNLLDGFGYWWKVLVLTFVTGVLVLLWSLLLIVPGVIAAYRYSMAQYLLITRPELGILDCLRESKRLTEGHKGELFMLDLSFIGWGLLCLLPFVGWILGVWVLPYYNISKLLCYEQISGADFSADPTRTPWEL